MAFAVDDTDAAPAGVLAMRQKFTECLTRFVPVHAVQIELILNHPASAPEIAQDAAGQAWAQIIGLVAAFEPVLEADRAVQAFMQCRPFIGQVLQWPGLWRFDAMDDAIDPWQRAGIAHRRVEGGQVVRIDQARPRLSR